MQVMKDKKGLRELRKIRRKSDVSPSHLDGGVLDKETEESTARVEKEFQVCVIYTFSLLASFQL